MNDVDIQFNDLLIDIRHSLDRVDTSLNDLDERVRKTEKDIVSIKTKWALLATACGVLGAVLVHFL